MEQIFYRVFFTKKIFFKETSQKIRKCHLRYFGIILGVFSNFGMVCEIFQILHFFIFSALKKIIFAKNHKNFDEISCSL
jgi:hypothetical protein